MDGEDGGIWKRDGGVRVFGREMVANRVRVFGREME